jgi:V/A-type H+-transporting ATPase subunit D
MPDIVPTRSAFLELQEERRGMREGYRFLDEKRLILAGELIAELELYETLKRQFEALYREAVAALRSAVERHGLEELEVYPALDTPDARIDIRTRNVLGVRVREARPESGASHTAPAVFPSPEAEQCRGLFQQVLQQATTLAARDGNLRRLREEYRLTSRRARALEDVLLPEMDATLRLVDSGLEEQEREEAIRVRHFTKRE